MNSLTAFFAFRPAFTQAGLRLVWFAVLLYEAFRLFLSVYGAFDRTQLLNPHFLDLVLQAVIYIVLVRIALEAAAVVLAGDRRFGDKVG